MGGYGCIAFLHGLPASQCTLSSGPKEFWCHHKKLFVLTAKPVMHLLLHLVTICKSTTSDSSLQSSKQMEIRRCKTWIPYWVVKSFKFQLPEVSPSTGSSMRWSIVVQEENTFRQRFSTCFPNYWPQFILYRIWIPCTCYCPWETWLSLLPVCRHLFLWTGAQSILNHLHLSCLPEACLSTHTHVVQIMYCVHTKHIIICRFQSLYQFLITKAKCPFVANWKWCNDSLLRCSLLAALKLMTDSAPTSSQRVIRYHIQTEAK
jgi:hypothetical protein